MKAIERRIAALERDPRFARETAVDTEAARMRIEEWIHMRPVELAQRLAHIAMSDGQSPAHVWLQEQLAAVSRRLEGARING